MWSQGTQAPCDAGGSALLVWARAVRELCSYPKKQAYSVFRYHIQQLQVALAASCWYSVECFPLLDILRLCVTDQQWEVHVDLRGLFNIFCAPDALTMSNNAQVWPFNGGNVSSCPTFITSFYIPILISFDISTAPLCWWADHWAHILCRLMCLLTELWAFLFSTSHCFNTLFDNFSSHYVPIKGTILYLFTFCHGCFFPLIYNLTSIRGNILLQDHVIDLELLSPSVVPGVTIKAHECCTLELSYWENPLPREMIEAITQDV